MDKNSKNMYMVVIVEKLLYAIDIRNIKSIIETHKTFPVASVKNSIYGIISVGNLLIPVFDAKLKLGYGVSEKSDRNRVLVIYSCYKGKDIVVGVLVNDIFKILNSEDLQKANALHEASDNPTSKKIEIFDLQTFLNDNDLVVIKEFYDIDDSISI